ncbi:secreted protein, putative, partial [Ixodes scapularis]
LKLLYIIISFIFNISSNFSAEDVCRAPHRGPSSCGTKDLLQMLYYFNNGSDKCERYLGCKKSKNDFRSEARCIKSCPYGKF